MSEIDKMLDNMSDDDIALYLGGESPEEEHVVIDSDRKIIVPDSLKRIAVQHDHDIETVTFDCPRYWDGHDLSKMMVYVNHLCPSGALGCTVATNVTVDSTNSDIMHFDWTISECVTMAEGHITFLVCAKTQDEDGTNRHHWNSEICRDMYVSEGLELPDDFMETYPDVLTQVLLFNQNVLELQKTTMQRSAVYVGTDDVPDGYNVWINPNGDAVTESGSVSSGSNIVSGGIDINSYYKNVQYTNEALSSNGTAVSGNANLSEYLPVIPGETLLLNSTLTTKVAFYKANKTCVGVIEIAASQIEYVVPENATFARFQNVYNGGSVRCFMCREKPIREITNLRELVLSPLKSTVDIGITGDSNTYGYNLTNREDEGWAFLFAKMLSTITSISVDYTSPYAHAWGYHHYSGGSNFKSASRFAIYTDAQSATLSLAANYSSVWKWYIDDVEQAETGATISGLSDSLKKIEVRFTSGQAVNPKLTIAKAITATNSAVVGANISNVTIPDNKDWLIIMIGTNNRGSGSDGIYDKFLQYAGKATYIVPFPNKKTDASYTISQAQLYSELANTFRDINYETCDCSPFAFAFTMNDDFYQSDKIHFNAAGHKAIANIVSGKLGLPICSI